MVETTQQAQQEKKRKAKYELSQEDFDRLLAVLDPERETAGEKFLGLEKRLLLIFGRQKDPKQHVDDTLDRYCKKLKNIDAGIFSPNEQEEIDNQEDEEGKNARRAEITRKVRDAIPYCIGIAKNIKREIYKGPQLDPLPDNFSETRAAPEPDPEPILVECYRKCLVELPDDKREMLLGYREGELREKIENRKRLAEKLGMTQVALRKNVERWQEKLRKCVEDCLKGKR